jgi:hypothetical protein
MVVMIFMKMISAAGAKEAELQGASSVVRGSWVIEAAQNAVAQTEQRET